MRFSFALMLFSIVFVAPACSESKDDVISAVRDSDRALQSAVSERALDRIASFYAEDAKLMPAAKRSIDGKPAIRAEWAEILAIPNFSNKSELKGVEVSDSSDIAYTHGSYLATLRGEDGNITEEPGKYLTVWRRQRDGSWKITIETYNTDIPPPDHK